jgi:type II secretory pathway pseudopilin PulG
MGQQQLLLTILVIIIVGVATVVAINTMQNARTESNETSVRQDILMILNDARVYYQKPAGLGGGGKSFDDISKNHILSVEPDNENGTYEISGSGNSVTVDGDGANDEVALTATATMTSDGMQISWSESGN